MTSQTKVILLGTGRMGRTHAEQWRKLQDRGDIEVVAICDVIRASAEAIQTECGFSQARIYTDLNQLISDGLEADLLDVVTPDHAHAGDILRGLQAGYSVIGEKPMCGSLSEAVAIQDFLLAHPTLRYYPVHSEIFHSAVRAALQMVQFGIVGRTLEVSTRHAYYHHDLFSRSTLRNDWRTSMYLDYGYHGFYRLIHAIRDSEPVRVYAEIYRHTELDLRDDTAKALVTFNDGTRGEVFVSYACRKPRPLLEVSGTDGTLWVEEFSGRSRIWYRQPEESGPGEVVEEYVTNGGVKELIGKQISDVVKCHRRHIEPVATIKEAMQTMKVIDAAERSSHLGQQVVI